MYRGLFYKGYTGFREHFMLCFWASLGGVVAVIFEDWAL